MLHRLFPCFFHSRGAALPVAPSNLTATQSTTVIGRIDLAWTDNSGDETGFSIEQSLDGSTGWAEVATPAANATSQAITSLTGGTTYYFRMRANRSGTYSAYSGTANAVAASADSVILAALGAGAWELSAEDSSGVDGTEVTAATDRSGNARNVAKQGANGPALYNAPTGFNGHKAWRFVANQQHTLYNTTWPVASTNAFAITIVFRTNPLISGSHGAVGLGLSGGGGQCLQFGLSANAPTGGQGLVITDHSSNLYDLAGTPMDDAKTWVMTIRRESASIGSVWVNGVKRTPLTIALTMTLTTDGFGIGGSPSEAAYHNGDIARVRMDGTAISDANIGILHTNLMAYYAIT